MVVSKRHCLLSSTVNQFYSLLFLFNFFLFDYFAPATIQYNTMPANRLSHCQRCIYVQQWTQFQKVSSLQNIEKFSIHVFCCFFLSGSILISLYPSSSIPSLLCLDPFCSTKRCPFWSHFLDNKLELNMKVLIILNLHRRHREMIPYFSLEFYVVLIFSS